VAEFIYDFPRMIKSGGAGEFCAYGYDQVTVAIIEKHREAIIITNENDLISDLSKKRCKVLYVSEDQCKKSSLAIRFANEANIVSLGIEDSFLEKGGAIMIKMGRRGIELEVNHKSMEKLKINLDPAIETMIIN